MTRETVFYDSDTNEIVPRERLVEHLRSKAMRVARFLVLPEPRPQWPNYVDAMPFLVTTWINFERCVHAVIAMKTAEREQ